MFFFATQVILLLGTLGVLHLSESVVVPYGTGLRFAPPSLITTKQCSFIMRSTSDIRGVSGGTVCLKLSQKELKQSLEKAGGFNPRYVAITEKQARAFKDLVKVLFSSTVKLPANTSTPIKDHAADENLDELSKHRSHTRSKRSILSSPGTALRGCVTGGSVVEGSSSVVHMCTECVATTRLEDDKFPTYINEVVCNDRNHLCAKNVGICKQRTLLQTFLRRTDEFERDDKLSQLLGITIYKEMWEEYTQEIRSCCECQVFLYKYQSF